MHISKWSSGGAEFDSTELLADLATIQNKPIEAPKEEAANAGFALFDDDEDETAATPEPPPVTEAKVEVPPPSVPEDKPASSTNAAKSAPKKSQ